MALKNAFLLLYCEVTICGVYCHVAFRDEKMKNSEINCPKKELE